MFNKLSLKFIWVVISIFCLNLRLLIILLLSLFFKMSCNQFCCSSSTPLISDPQRKRSMIHRLLRYLPCIPQEESEDEETSQPIIKNYYEHITPCIKSPNVHDIYTELDEFIELTKFVDKTDNCEIMNTWETSADPEGRGNSKDGLNKKFTPKIYRENTTGLISRQGKTTKNYLHKICNKTNALQTYANDNNPQTLSTSTSRDDLASKSSTINYTHSKEAVCPICLESFGSDSKLYGIPHQPHLINVTKGCKHTFCSQCLRLWTLQQMKIKRHLGKCPVCHCGIIDDDIIQSVLEGDEKSQFFIIKNSILSGDFKMDDQQITSSMIDDLEVHGFKRCKGCGIAVQQEGQLDDLKCRCGFRFCFVCGESLGRGTIIHLIYHQRTCKGERTPVFFALC